AMRRREDNRVDRRVGEDVVDAVPVRDAVLRTEGFGMGAGGVVSGVKEDGPALALPRAAKHAPPPPDPDNRRPNHPPLLRHTFCWRGFYTVRAAAAMPLAAPGMTPAPSGQ